MQNIDQQENILDVLRRWPRPLKVGVVAVVFPVCGHVVGAVLQTLLMSVTEPFTIAGVVAFAMPLTLFAALALSLRRPSLALLGLAPQILVLAWVCKANHASLGQLEAFWPLVFPAVVGPALGLWAMLASFKAIEPEAGAIALGV